MSQSTYISPTPDWSALPIPVDDHACDHLPCLPLPSDLQLPATNDTHINLSRQKDRLVLFCYPRTGTSGEDYAEWDLIPGARGCTPQMCAFRDMSKEFTELKVAAIYGLSTQSLEVLKETKERLHTPFELLSDEGLQLTKALKLPTFDWKGKSLLKRVTLVIRDGVIERYFYPIFPPDKNAKRVIEWLKTQRECN